MDDFFWTGLIFLLAGFTQGVSGFGAGLVAMPLLLLFMEAKVAVPFCMLNGLAITLMLSLQLRRSVQWHKVRPLFWGCLPGIALGALLLRGADNRLLEVLLGILVIAYCFYSLTFTPRIRRLHPVWPVMAGFGTGIIGSLFSAGGPPTIIYLTLTGWDKDEIKATLSFFFFVTGIFIAAGHALCGLTTWQVLAGLPYSLPFVVAGVVSGVMMYGRIPQKTYIRLILYLLLVVGFMMILV
ncbi:MAG: sulfite exporter TauE/SafE family protein [Desulfurivibrionaceae bacterium]